MRMTLFVDASFCHQTKAGGWGAWAIRDGWARGQFSGGPIRLREYTLSSSTTAEIAGVALALWQLKAAGSLDGIDELMIQCDCIPALALIYKQLPNVKVYSKNKKHDQRFDGNYKLPSPVVTKVIATIRELIGGIPQVKVRHVKGHRNPGEDGRSWVNDQCDAEAKRHMVALRKELAMLVE